MATTADPSKAFSDAFKATSLGFTAVGDYAKSIASPFVEQQDLLKTTLANSEKLGTLVSDIENTNEKNAKAILENRTKRETLEAKREADDAWLEQATHEEVQGADGEMVQKAVPEWERLRLAAEKEGLSPKARHVLNVQHKSMLMDEMGRRSALDPADAIKFATENGVIPAGYTASKAGTRNQWNQEEFVFTTPSNPDPIKLSRPAMLAMLQDLRKDSGKALEEEMKRMQYGTDMAKTRAMVQTAQMRSGDTRLTTDTQRYVSDNTLRGSLLKTSGGIEEAKINAAGKFATAGGRSSGTGSRGAAGGGAVSSMGSPFSRSTPQVGGQVGGQVAPQGAQPNPQYEINGKTYSLQQLDRIAQETPGLRDYLLEQVKSQDAARSKMVDADTMHLVNAAQLEGYTLKPEPAPAPVAPPAPQQSATPQQSQTPQQSAAPEPQIQDEHTEAYVAAQEQLATMNERLKAIVETQRKLREEAGWLPDDATREAINRLGRSHRAVSQSINALKNQIYGIDSLRKQAAAKAVKTKAQAAEQQRMDALLERANSLIEAGAN